MNLLSLYIFWLLTVVAGSSPDCPPRRYVSHHEANATRFNEDGVFNYSTMLLREDLGLLMLGARETVFALDLNNISTKRALVRWEVTEAEKMDCQNKGKGPEDCKNYIKILHKMADNRMFVCGTRGFAPQCAYMTFSDGILTLQNNRLEGTEKCPHDPDKSFASLMDNNTLYTAVYRNFRGTEPLLSRHPDTISSYNIRLRTETSLSIFKEPTFASMAQISQSGKVYLFFGEKPVECDCFNKMAVSRVARVCKGDQGGQNILQNRWTSFLKARIDCPVQNSQLPYIIQDTYLWCDPQQQSSGCLFYGIFTPQSNTSDTSAVCVYRVSDIDRRFAEGDYKTKGTVSTTTFTKWIKNTGVVPSPRPGAVSLSPFWGRVILTMCHNPWRAAHSSVSVYTKQGPRQFSAPPPHIHFSSNAFSPENCPIICVFLPCFHQVAPFPWGTKVKWYGTVYSYTKLDVLFVFVVCLCGHRAHPAYQVKAPFS